MKYCTRCGREMPEGANFCPNCGHRADGSEQGSAYTRTAGDKPRQNDFMTDVTTDFYGRNRLCASLFGILLGTFGIHEFYLGNTFLGILSVLFCWTGIPALVGLVKGIMYLCQPNEEFKGHISDKIKAKYPSENQNDGWKF